jgi:hypothetical protein
MRCNALALASWLASAAALGAGVGVVPGTAGRAAAQADDVSDDEFSVTLSPYGTWVAVDGVGRAWRPRAEIVGEDFQPYATGGHWVYTDYGWSFESDWDWGWAPFHYGRWYSDPGYGWVWVEGRTWGPAWVDWRAGGGYVGWVPSAPEGVRVTYIDSSRPWSFVPETRFTDRHSWEYRVPRERAQVAYSASAVVTAQRTWSGTRYNAGPPPARIASVTGRRVTPVRFTPPRRGEVTAVRVTARGVEQHALPAPARPAPAAPGPQGGSIVRQHGATRSPAAPAPGAPRSPSPAAADPPHRAMREPARPVAPQPSRAAPQRPPQTRRSAAPQEHAPHSR